MVVLVAAPRRVLVWIKLGKLIEIKWGAGVWVPWVWGWGLRKLKVMLMLILMPKTVVAMAMAKN
jgi:hypothetical protein